MGSRRSRPAGRAPAPGRRGCFPGPGRTRCRARPRLAAPPRGPRPASRRWSAHRGGLEPTENPGPESMERSSTPVPSSARPRRSTFPRPPACFTRLVPSSVATRATRPQSDSSRPSTSASAVAWRRTSPASEAWVTGTTGSAPSGLLPSRHHHPGSLPGVDSMENSFISRRAPGSPSPIPVPVVNPSRRAAVRSGMPGPRSSKVSRMPRRVPFSTASSRASPPLPCSRVFRASSLAAVTTLV